MASITKLLTLAILLISLNSMAQMGINTTGSDPDPSAMLDISSTDKGFLLPRMTEVQRLDLMNPALGLMVYQTDGAQGFYYHNGSQWVLMGDDINHTGYSNIFLNNLTIDGSQCVGIDCNTNENFGFATIKLKENNTRIQFLDTSTDPGDPNNEWWLEANESQNGGLSAFFLSDATNGQRPFLIEAQAPTNAFYITSGGNVGIGTNSPSEKLEVAGDLFVNGDITATGAINNLSDARLKTNIEPLNGALSTLNSLRPVEYNFNCEVAPGLKLSAERQIGLLAQDVEEILPELVRTDSDNRHLSNLKSVNYIELIPFLIKGVQEQQAQIDEKAANISELESQIAEMKELDARLKMIEALLSENQTSNK